MQQRKALLSTLKKYHNKPFGHYEKLSQIGGSNRATGAFAHSGGRGHGKGKGKDMAQPIQPIAQSHSQPITGTESITQPISQSSTTQPITRPAAPSNDDNDDDDTQSLDHRDIAAALNASSFQKVPPFSGPPDAPILELTPEAIWRMAPEVVRSLLGLRGDDNTPIDIESICGIMQQ